MLRLKIAAPRFIMGVLGAGSAVTFIACCCGLDSSTPTTRQVPASSQTINTSDQAESKQAVEPRPEAEPTPVVSEPPQQDDSAHDDEIVRVAVDEARRNFAAAIGIDQSALKFNGATKKVVRQGGGVDAWVVNGKFHMAGPRGVSEDHGYAVYLIRVDGEFFTHQIDLDGTPTFGGPLAQALAERGISDAVPTDTPVEEKPVEELRTWSDRSGKFSVEARYSGYKPGFVILEKADGATIDVELSKLREADRLYAVRTAKERGDR